MWATLRRELCGVKGLADLGRRQVWISAMHREWDPLSQRLMRPGLVGGLDLPLVEVLVPRATG